MYTFPKTDIPSDHLPVCLQAQINSDSLTLYSFNMMKKMREFAKGGFNNGFGQTETKQEYQQRASLQLKSITNSLDNNPSISVVCLQEAPSKNSAYSYCNQQYEVLTKPDSILAMIIRKNCYDAEYTEKLNATMNEIISSDEGTFNHDTRTQLQKMQFAVIKTVTDHRVAIINVHLDFMKSCEIALDIINQLTNDANTEFGLMPFIFLGDFNRGFQGQPDAGAQPANRQKLSQNGLTCVAPNEPTNVSWNIDNNTQNTPTYRDAAVVNNQISNSRLTVDKEFGAVSGHTSFA